MPVDVTIRIQEKSREQRDRAFEEKYGYLPVHDPRARVIGSEANRDVVASGTYVHDVSSYGIVIVVRITPSTANDVERMPMQMQWMLITYIKLSTSYD